MKLNIKTIKYSQEFQPDFINTLRKKIKEYFQINRISKFGNMNMILKTVFMFSLLMIPYFLMIFGVFSNLALFFLLWITMGFGMAGIGLSVMHDANHGSYSKHSRLNKILGYTLNLMGGNSSLWKIQHNYLHHAFTNIQGADDDINVPVFLRLSPHAKKYMIQRFQHLYFWFFYGLSTLTWVTFKNALQISEYRKRGLITGKRVLGKELILEVAWKLFYYGYVLILPMLLLPVSPWLILAAFVIMHFITGLTLGLIFQPAHVMPTSQYPLPDIKGNIKNNWAIHQMMTTSNFSPDSRIFSWLVGGLNYQIEHHLFPNICHVHYKNISKIVKKTAVDFGIPYHVQPSFTAAIRNHVKMLKNLGNFSENQILKKQTDENIACVTCS